MKPTIIAFGASNSENSINKAFASYAAKQIKDVIVKNLDLNDFEMPIYKIEREQESGIPPSAYAFQQAINNAQGIIISFAEHNGAYSAAYKNIYDWVSRIGKDNLWNNKPMLLLATSPGERGGMSVLELAYQSYSRSNKNVIGKFSLPSFQQNFDSQKGIKNAELHMAFERQLQLFAQAIKSKWHPNLVENTK